jgi:hypothetical protein
MGDHQGHKVAIKVLRHSVNNFDKMTRVGCLYNSLTTCVDELTNRCRDSARRS